MLTGQGFLIASKLDFRFFAYLLPTVRYTTIFTYTLPPSPLFLFPSLNIYWQKRGKEREGELVALVSLFSLPRLDLAAAAAAGEEEDD